MSKLRILSACLVVCLVATMSSTSMANLITNGDFESVTEGTFDYWTGPTTYTVATDPMNIGGTNSARLLKGGTAGAGMMKQTFDVDGLSDFQIDFDFAFLWGGVSVREFALFTYAGSTIVDNVSMWSTSGTGHIIQYHGTTAAGNPAQTTFHSTSPWMLGDVTTDTGILKVFDGETPDVNHLTMVGRGYGTENYSLEITIDSVERGTLVWPITNHLEDGTSLAIDTIAFYGGGGAVDCLVDNVSVVEVPEPGTIVLLLTGLVGLVCSIWKRRQ